MQSGETFTLEMATHLAGDAPELMIDGDPALQEIYKCVRRCAGALVCVVLTHALTVLPAALLSGLQGQQGSRLRHLHAASCDPAAHGQGDKLLSRSERWWPTCRWDKNGQNIKMRGATGKGDGKHVLTGPIFLCGAEPGDVIEVR